MVCIDDFALKKRQRYGTVMIDIETHKIVDMLNSREITDVKQWLSRYPNLRVVSRDGSQVYAAAINETHPKAMQISDRFHILKNLNDRAILVFQKLFQGRIAIPVTLETQHIRYMMLVGTSAQCIKLVKKLKKEGRNYSEISLLTGASIKIVKKYVNMKECDIPKNKQTVRDREHEDAVKKLINRADKVKNLRNAGLSMTEIAQKTGFTSAVVKNYLSADFSPVNAHYGKQREGKLEPFREEVFKLRLEGLKYKEIFKRIKVKGYSGTQDAIRGFISKERRIQRDLQTAVGGSPVEFIDKKWMIRLLYKPIEEIKGISPAQLSVIFTNYPLSKQILCLVNEFKSIFKKKNLKAFPLWIEKATALKLSEIDSFINGLKQDIDAVMNAITSNFSNGLAEGTVNKIKVIKRIMYGRCRFETLRNKCLLLQHFN